LAGSFLTEADEVKSGLYGWIIYGLLIFVHWSYYADHYYWNYTQDKYGMLHLTWRTWYGVGTWLHDFTKTAAWGLMGLSWCFSLIPVTNSFQYFAELTTYMLMIETLISFVHVTMTVISSFAESDQY